MRRIIFTITMFFVVFFGIFMCMDASAATIEIPTIEIGVVKGDTIWGISEKNHVLFLWGKVKKLNIGRFADINKIYPGDTVLIPDISTIKHIENAKNSTAIIPGAPIASAKSLNHVVEHKSDIPMASPFQEAGKSDVRKINAESVKHQAELMSGPSIVAKFLHQSMKVKVVAVLFFMAVGFLMLLICMPEIVCGKPRAERKKFYGHGIIASDSLKDFFILFDGENYVFIEGEERTYQSDEIKDVAHFAATTHGDCLIRFDVPKELKSKYTKIKSSQQKAVRKIIAARAGQDMESCKT